MRLYKFYPRHPYAIALARLCELGDSEVAASPTSIARTEVFVKLPGDLGIVHAANDDAAARERLLAGERDQTFDDRTDGLRAGLRRLDAPCADEVVRKVANKRGASALQTAKFFTFF